MKVLMTPDVPDWAIGALSNSIMKHLPHVDFEVMYVHPREVVKNLYQLQELIKNKEIDVWHAQYWNSAVQMLDILPALKDVPCILSHHNHHSLDKGSWKDFTFITAPTKWCLNKLKEDYKNVAYIPYGLDMERFSYIKDHDEDLKTIGYIGRVMPHKNLKKICDAATKLDYKVVGSGYVEKDDYWKTVDTTNLEFYGGRGRAAKMPQSFKDRLYEKMGIFCMYSTENKETGTLPLLEAMSRGIPVLTTDEGMARDICKDGENCIKFNDDNFEEKLKMLMEDKELRQKIRHNAFMTMCGYTEQKMARSYERLYYDVAHPDHKMISVVIPTYNNAESLMKAVVAIDANDYPKKEIVIVDDGSDDETQMVLAQLKKQLKTTVKVLHTGNDKNYGLAKARNLGVQEAIGEIVVFVDDRLELHDNALELIEKNTIAQTWSFGNKMVKGKPGNKNKFVENLSWIYKADLVRGGMFNERINKYGAMSAELRLRFASQGFGFNYVPDVLANEIKKSNSKSTRTGDIWQAKLLLNKLYE